jgi:dipeptide/tripeptide permease
MKIPGDSLIRVERAFRLVFFVLILVTFAITFAVIYVAATYGIASLELATTLFVLILCGLAFYTIVRVFYAESGGEGKYTITRLYKSVLIGLLPYSLIAVVVCVSFLVFGASWQWLLICIAVAILCFLVVAVYNNRKQQRIENIEACSNVVS